jgi:hypothetical protein
MSMLKHLVLWGRLSNLRPIGKSACREEAAGTLTAAPLCEAANPAAGFCRKRRSRQGPPVTRVSALSSWRKRVSHLDRHIA